MDAVRNALDLWNEKSELNLFNYTNVNEDNRQIRVDYSRDEGFPQFSGHQIRDEDGRYRFDSGVVYLRNDDGSVQLTAEHEFGHATGWGNESPNEKSIMNPNGSNGVGITEDDGYTVRTSTTLPNFTP